MNLRKAFEEWKEWAKDNRAENTAYSQGAVLNQWILHSVPGQGKHELDDITSKHVTDFINREDGVSLSQRKFRLATIQSLLSLMVERGEVKGNVAAKLRVNMKKLTHKQKEPRKKVPFTEDQVKLVVEGACGRHAEFFKAATAISYCTGLRLSDIANLEWDAFISDPNHMVVWTAKAGDKQHARVALPLDEPLVGEAIADTPLRNVINTLSLNDPQYVFPEERGLMNNVRTRSHLPQYYIRMLKRKGLDGLSFHCLRHAFVTRLKKAGKTFEEISKLVAHQDESTTEGYSHE